MVGQWACLLWVIHMEIVVSALQMCARHTQRCDQHGNASQQEHSSTQCKESTQQNQPMLVDNQNAEPDQKQQSPGYFAHVKGPRNVRHIVQKDIGQWWIALHIWHTFVHDHHHNRCNPCDQERIAYATTNAKEYICVNWMRVSCQKYSWAEFQTSTNTQFTPVSQHASDCVIQEGIRKIITISTSAIRIRKSKSSPTPMGSRLMNAQQRAETTIASVTQQPHIVAPSSDSNKLLQSQLIDNDLREKKFNFQIFMETKCRIQEKERERKGLHSFEATLYRKYVSFTQNVT